MSPPALSSLFMGCFSLLSSSVSTMLQDTIAVQSLSFSTPTDQTYFVSPSSLRGPLFLHPSLGALSFRPLCYSPVFFVITFHLEVESGGVRQHGAKLSWGFILWKTSHLNADGNIFRWFNSTLCNIPNQGFVFSHLFPCYAYWVYYKLLYLTNNRNVSGGAEGRKTNAKNPWANLFWAY